MPYLAGAYYASASSGQEADYLLPWKLRWDPTRDFSHRSVEIINVTSGAGPESSENPDTFERSWRHDLTGNLPLRHSIFSLDAGVEIRVRPTGSSTWEVVPNAVAIEGEAGSETAPLISRRDFALTEDANIDIGRVLTRNGSAGNAIVGSTEWQDIDLIEINILYVGDYVIPDSFNQDLHHDAYVQLRNLDIILDSTSRGVYGWRNTSRHLKTYVDMESPFIRGANRPDPSSHSEITAGNVFSQSLRATSSVIRTGSHQTTYTTIDPTHPDNGASPVGTWPSVDYWYIDKTENSIATPRNFILSHRQRNRLTLGAALNEATEEVALQYDSTENTWQMGSQLDTLRREYNENTEPFLTRRYPIVARFAQGRTASTNTGFVGAGPTEALNVEPTRQALITSYPNHPTALRRHSAVHLVATATNRYLSGMNRLELLNILGSSVTNRIVAWDVLVEGSGDLVSTQSVGVIGHTLPQRHVIDLRADPTQGTTSYGANSTRLRLIHQSGTTEPFFSIQGTPSNAASSPQYSSGINDIIRIGLRGHGSASAAKHVYIGKRNEGSEGTYIPVARGVQSSFDVVFASHVFPRVRGNMAVEGILDTYGDIALGRQRGPSPGTTPPLTTAVNTLGADSEPALIRGGWQADRVEINRSTSGIFNILGNTLFHRRVSGHTVSRIDLQLRKLLGLEVTTSPTLGQDTYRDYKPYEVLSSHIENARDKLIAGETDLVEGVAATSGKTDSYASTYTGYEYSGNELVVTDYTGDVIRAFINDEDRVANIKVRSGYARGQLHRDGLSARGEFGNVPVSINTAGIPNTGVAHDGDPQHLINSSDMYLDADGTWRYLFDRVYLPVENN